MLALVISFVGFVSYDLAEPRENNLVQVAGPVLPDSKLYSLKIFGEKLRLYLSKTEYDRERLRVIFLNRRLAEAEALLQNGKSGLAQQLINKFAQGSTELTKQLKKQDYLRLDPKRATEIEKAMADQIDLQKSLMANIGLTSPLYELKEKLLTLELDLADTPEDKKQVAEEQKREQARPPAMASSTEFARLSDWVIVKQELELSKNKCIAAARRSLISLREKLRLN